MKYWLLKTEGDIYPIEALEKDKKTPWSGVRNFRARNYMRDEMSVGDLCLFYHSSCKEPGVYGIATVASRPYADPTQFDQKSEYFDSRSSVKDPRWMMVDIAFKRKLKKPLTSALLKKDAALKNMLLWRIAQLSIQPVEKKEFERIIELSAEV